MNYPGSCQTKPSVAIAIERAPLKSLALPYLSVPTIAIEFISSGKKYDYEKSINKKVGL